MTEETSMNMLEILRMASLKNKFMFRHRFVHFIHEKVNIQLKGSCKKSKLLSIFIKILY